MEGIVFHTVIAKRNEIRDRALLYAEYALFNKLQQSVGHVELLSNSEWIAEVKRIEFHILHEEAPSLLTYQLDRWEPRGIFFDLILSGGH